MALMSKVDAKKAGKRAGLAAASWKFDGNTSKATYEHFLKGLADGDPEVLDAYMPPSWLSGEFAGESMNELIGSPDTPAQEERVDDVAQAYELAAEGAYWHELERMARYAVGGRRGPRRFNPVRSGVRQRATARNPRHRRVVATYHGIPIMYEGGHYFVHMTSRTGSPLYHRSSSERSAKQFIGQAIRAGAKIPPAPWEPGSGEGKPLDNPKVTVFHANPRRGGRPILQSSRVYEIAYKHVKDGKAYKHPFKTGVCMELLPDGSIRIYSRTGKRLWKDFR